MKKITSFELFILIVTVAFICFIAVSFLSGIQASITIIILLGLFATALIQIANNAEKNIL
jgi:hypothetical protein